MGSIRQIEFYVTELDKKLSFAYIYGFKNIKNF
jgi:hypothetical protein